MKEPCPLITCAAVLEEISERYSLRSASCLVHDSISQLDQRLYNTYSETRYQTFSASDSTKSNPIDDVPTVSKDIQKRLPLSAGLT